MRKLVLLVMVYICASFSIKAQINLNQGLVAYYPFNGNANDESGNGRNGIVQGSILTEDRKGVPNQAYSFIGQDNYILASNGISGNTFSISVWIKNKFTDTNRHEIIDFGTDPTNKGFFLYVFDNKVTCSVSNIFGSFTSNSCTSEEWHHIVVTSLNGLVSLYLDGTFRSSFDFPNMNITGFNFSIGSIFYDNSYWHYSWYNGIIDDIRLYNRVITEDEIKTLFDGTASKTTDIYNLDTYAYPNPTSKILTFSNISSKASISIYDINGKLLSNTMILNNQIDMSNFPKGIYTIVINEMKKVKTIKVIKK